MIFTLLSIYEIKIPKKKHKTVILTCFSALKHVIVTEIITALLSTTSVTNPQNESIYQIEFKKFGI